MNSKFTDEQIKAYASSFREGDAIWCNGKWRKMSKSTKFPLGLTCESPNKYVIRCFDGEVAISGFKEEDDTVYRVTTLDDYKLQGGEKIVWLGDTITGHLTFGDVYFVKEVNSSINNTVSEMMFINDVGVVIRVDKYDNWGIIPRYKKVSKQEPLPYGEELEQEMKRGLEHVVHYPTVADREEEMLMLKTFEKLTNGVDVKYIVDELKGIMEFALNNGDYNVAIGAIELIKEWEEMK